MPTAQVPIPINGYSDSLNHQHGAEGFSTSMLNVVPMDNFEHRRRVGTRQGFSAIADMGTNDDYNIQELLTYEVYRDTSLLREVLIVAGASVFYTDSAGDTHDVAYSTAAATSTVTFTDVPTVDETIIITDTAGTSKTYTAKLVETLASNEFTIGGGAGATATVKMSGVPAADQTITIISTDGTSKTYRAGADSSEASGIFDRTGTVAEAAESLRVCMLHANGHNGKITATRSIGDLVFTQVLAGTGGNTTITSDLASTAVVSFGGDSTVVAGANTAAGTATSLTACINHASGHGSTITAVATDKVVALTQDAVGTATSTGNTDVTSTLSNATATNFKGAAFAAGTNRIHKSDTVRGVIYGTYAYLATGRQYYKVDLSVTTPVIEEWTNYNGAGGMPTDTYGNKCNLIARFGARIAMSGISSSRNNWFMSKIGDAEDWTPTAGNTSDAQAGDSSTDFGVLGEPITAMFPFGESGLMMAGRGSLTFLTADPVVSGAQMVRMSNGVGVMGPDAWCQGPEKTCYVASGDGVYLIQPNQFNIQRGQSVTTGRLDAFFTGINPSEIDLHLAYDPPRGTIVMYVNREDDPDNSIHYIHHIATQSWWTFKVTDARVDVVRATCLYSPISGEREGLWIGCKSGRIATQPNSGVVAYDGGAHASPLKATSNNSPNTDTKVAFSSRLAWSPINSGLTNERLLLTELDVLLDRHTVTATDGITAAGPTLNLYGAETAQTLSGISGDIKVTQTELVIDGGVALFAADTPSSTSFDCGNADTKAYAIITVADGDDDGHGLAALQYIMLTDNETTPVTKRYVLVDGIGSGAVSTGAAMTTGADTGFGTLPAELSPAVAVNINIATSTETAHEFLTQLKAAIEHANGHNGKIVVSTIDTQADGPQSMTLTQYTAFRGGNTPITETLASSVTVPSVFVGGQTTAVATEYTPAVEATIELHEATIGTLNGQVMVLNDLGSGTSAVTLTFDSSLAVNASTTSLIGCADADENYLSIMKAVKKSIDLNYSAGLLNIRTEEPYLDTQSKMVLRMSDAWNGLDLLTGLTITGSAVSNNHIEGESFALQAGTNWKQFINGGRAADITGTYALNDTAASESMRKWTRESSYTVRMGGNTSYALEPQQFRNKWGVFGTEDNSVPLYLAAEETASLSLSTWTSTEILPSNFTASTVIVDPEQDETTKRLLQTWTLARGRNNRYRVRKRESDFQVEITASGTAWVLEDLALNIEKGGAYRSVITT